MESFRRDSSLLDVMRATSYCSLNYIDPRAQLFELQGEYFFDWIGTEQCKAKENKYKITMMYNAR